MAHSTRQAVAPPRKGKPKRKQREEEGVFEDVVVLDIPRKVLVGPFRIDVPLHGRRRREPNPVIEPDARED
jgi:hypothetical protein